MFKRLRSLLYSSAALLLAVVVGFGTAQGQDSKPFMTPYEPDSNTVLLLHFDGNTDNASPLDVGDGIPHGGVSFTTSNVSADFNQMMYLDNNEISDSSYVSFPDTAAMDIRGNWTMEGWVHILTYGRDFDDHRWRPKVLVKPGEDTRSFSNYFNVLRGDLRAFHTGWYSPSGGGWFAVTSPDNSFQAGTWYHFAYIRDTTDNLVVQLVHDIDGNLLHMTTGQFDPLLNHPPAQTTMPAYTGINLGQGGGWLDGFIDELRVSNVVRTFNTPPILTSLSQLPNQPPQQASDISVNVNTLGDNTVSSVTLHYRVDDGDWQTSSMSSSEESVYTTQIPAQSSGSTVEYYVTGTADNGMKASIPGGTTDTSGTYQNYAVVKDSTQIMNLTFDGESTSNEADINLPLTLHGNPTFKAGAKGTDHSIFLEGDSSYIKIDNPRASFLRSEEFVIDFWLQAVDSLPDGGTRYMIKEDRPSWNDFNYQIWSPGGGAVVPASFAPPQGRTGNLTGLSASIDTNNWYRVVYVMQSDTTYSRLYDSNNELIDTQGGAISGDVHLSTGPFYLGANSPATEDLQSPFGVPDGPLFRGKYDEVKMYNYVPEEYKDSVAVAIDEPNEVPDRITLEQNYPNPFNPTTSISYSVPAAKHITLEVYDVTGREVATLVDKRQQAGNYTVKFDGSNLASGVYFYRLSTEDYNKIRKMLLLK